MSLMLHFYSTTHLLSLTYYLLYLKSISLRELHGNCKTLFSYLNFNFYISNQARVCCQTESNSLWPSLIRYSLHLLWVLPWSLFTFPICWHTHTHTYLHSQMHTYTHSHTCERVGSSSQRSRGRWLLLPASVRCYALWGIESPGTSELASACVFKERRRAGVTYACVSCCYRPICSNEPHGKASLNHYWASTAGGVVNGTRLAPQPISSRPHPSNGPLSIFLGRLFWALVMTRMWRNRFLVVRRAASLSKCC